MRIALSLIALVALVGSGAVHGIKTDRWGMPKRVQAAADRIASIPATIGPWRSQDRVVDPRELAISEAVGYMSRTYVNQADGTAVHVMILCGRPGPISVHPPTVCFTASGLVPTGDVQSVELETAQGAPLGAFHVVDFQYPSAASATRMRTFWAWSYDGRWQAPQLPRTHFASQPYLYKLYVVREVPLGSIDPDDGPVVEFMRIFLPEVHEALFSGA